MIRPWENLYIHVPFCAGKCDYCAFYSEPVPDEALMRKWLDRILAALAACASNPVPFRTVYFGGGTPTLLPDELLRRLFSAVHALPLAQNAELSMEANPFTITQEKADLLAANVNRVSLGVQSFLQRTLCTLGRRPHAGPDAGQAVAALRSAGLQNIGLDLIFGAPGQTLDEWRSDLERALALEPRHISAYSVIAEEGTPYAERTRDVREDDELQCAMLNLCGDMLSAHGLQRYEISNFAIPGYESRHNSNVWHGGTYLGLGPSAVSFDGADRSMEAPDVRLWLAGEPPVVDRISPEARAAEMLMMGLRTVDGWQRGEFAAASGMDWGFLMNDLAALRDDGMLELTDETLKPTPRGLLYWNDIGEVLVRVS